MKNLSLLYVILALLLLTAFWPAEGAFRWQWSPEKSAPRNAAERLQQITENLERVGWPAGVNAKSIVSNAYWTQADQELKNQLMTDPLTFLRTRNAGQGTEDSLGAIIFAGFLAKTKLDSSDVTFFAEHYPQVLARKAFMGLELWNWIISDPVGMVQRWSYWERYKFFQEFVEVTGIDNADVAYLAGPELEELNAARVADSMETILPPSSEPTTDAELAARIALARARMEGMFYPSHYITKMERDTSCYVVTPKYLMAAALDAISSAADTVVADSATIGDTVATVIDTVAIRGELEKAREELDTTGAVADADGNGEDSQESSLTEEEKNIHLFSVEP